MSEKLQKDAGDATWQTNIGQNAGIMSGKLGGFEAALKTLQKDVGSRGDGQEALRI